jgi:uncharacterized surface protein with fasciclin (FAS1) repeats
LTELSTQGVTVELPAGFEGRTIRRAKTPTRPAAAGAAGASPLPLNRSAAPPESTLAIVHAATVPLPPEVGDFGSNVVEILGSDDVFVVVFEYDASAANTALFAERGTPRSLPFEAFSPTLLQRSIKGQSGAQRFFTEADRAFCLYAVLGADARRSTLVEKVNTLLASLTIEPLAAAGGAGPGTQPPSTTTTVPLGTVVDVIAAQADLATFVELLDTAQLRAVVAGTGPFTVFAPTDRAFSLIDLDALRADPLRLRHTLGYHLVADDLHVEALQARRQVSTLAGPSVTIGRSGAAVMVDQATLVRPDLDANNGVVHVVDQVLEPPA